MNKFPIDTSNKITELRSASQESTNAKKSSEAKGKGSQIAMNHDNVSVSGRASEALELSGRLGKLPDVRSNLVSHFKESIAAGNYNPSSSNISNAILNEEL